MSDKIHDVSADWAKRAWIDDAKYREMYARSIKDPNGFWSEAAKRVDWVKPFTKVENTSFELGKVSIKWFEDGVLNAAYNCIDRHLEKRGDQTAIIWEGDNPSESRHISYRELHDEVCKMANILRLRNVKKGDRVTIYLPMIPEAAYAILACARIGAIHSVVFGGFSPDSIAGRLRDCKSRVVITSDEGLRGGRTIAMKANVDQPVDVMPDRIDSRLLGLAAYVKPSVGLQLLRQEILGPAAFDEAFREYVRRWAFKHPTPTDFFRTMESVGGERLDWFWREWFYENTHFDEAIESVQTSDSSGVQHVVVVHVTDTKAPRTIKAVATEIYKTWKAPYFGARPYLLAMMSLTDRTSMYGCEDAKGIVAYFLSNATTWRGEDARRIKAELKSIVGIK